MDIVEMLRAEFVADSLVDEAAAEIERLRALVLDACRVLNHYDLPEHAFHYRRALKP